MDSLGTTEIGFMRRFICPFNVSGPSVPFRALPAQRSQSLPLHFMHLYIPLLWLIHTARGRERDRYRNGTGTMDPVPVSDQDEHFYMVLHFVFGPCLFLFTGLLLDFLNFVPIHARLDWVSHSNTMEVLTPTRYKTAKIRTIEHPPRVRLWQLWQMGLHGIQLKYDNDTLVP